MAQYCLGVLYANGIGIEQSYTEAIYWYQKAAEQGLAVAQYSLGVAYYNVRYYTQAIYWWEKACENGVEEACEILNKIKK